MRGARAHKIYDHYYTAPAPCARGVSVIEILEHGKTVKYHITSITPVLQDLANFLN